MAKAFRYLLADRASRGYLVGRYCIAPTSRAVQAVCDRLAQRGVTSRFELDRPIFIVGCSRSGTSAFARALGEHVDVLNWSEIGQLFEPRYYDPGIDHIKDESDVGVGDRLRLQFICGLALRISGRSRFLNKHPQNSLRLPFLKSVFPDAIFIHLIRDGRAVIWSSLRKLEAEAYRARYPFGNFPKPPNWREYLHLPPSLQFAHQWREIIEHVRRQAAACLGPETYIEVRYEDICEDTTNSLRRLDEYCGLDHDKRDTVRLEKQLRKSRADWTEGLPPETLREIDEILGDTLAALGYSSHDAGS